MLKKSAFATFAVAAAASVILMPANAHGTYASHHYTPYGNFETVQDLYSVCTRENDPTSIFICVSYVGGAGDMMVTIGGGNSAKNKATYGDIENVKSFGICSKDIITHGAEVQAFKNWVEKNPQMWSQPMILGVIFALRTTWPCT